MPPPMQLALQIARGRGGARGRTTSASDRSRSPGFLAAPATAIVHQAMVKGRPATFTGSRSGVLSAPSSASSSDEEAVPYVSDNQTGESGSVPPLPQNPQVAMMSMEAEVGSVFDSSLQRLAEGCRGARAETQENPRLACEDGSRGGQCPGKDRGEGGGSQV